MSNITASIITIGDELLIGQVIDTNSAWIARKLNALGIDVIRRVAVGDDRHAILTALDYEVSISSLVLITGGLGPTNDDITKPLLNEYFGGKMVVDEAVVEHLKNLFIRRNRPFLEKNLKQAEVPDNCIVLFNKMGTAPGMWFEKDDKVVVAMPGVPFEMASIMEDEVLPRIATRFVSDALLHRSIITIGEGETFIAEKIKDIEDALPGRIRLAYLPGAGMVKLRLTGRTKNELELTKELNEWQRKIEGRLGDIVVASEDRPLEDIIGRILKEKGKTIGLAESCTGGYIGHHLTQVSGSSAYFIGDIVSYANAVKENIVGVKSETIQSYGAVSEQVATEMAQGALKVLRSDYALSVTGVLGPGGGGTDRVSVGTVWMAMAGNGTVTTRRFSFPYDRARNKEMAASMGMQMIIKFIRNQ